MTGNATATITQERYEDLLDSEKRLLCLEDAGVDNWSGYEFAVDLYEMPEE